MPLAIFFSCLYREANGMVENLKADTLYITLSGFKGAKVRRAYKVYMHRYLFKIFG